MIINIDIFKTHLFKNYKIYGQLKGNQLAFWGECNHCNYKSFFYNTSQEVELPMIFHIEKSCLSLHVNDN